MKEAISAFGSEVFRPLMTLFAPGMFALAPWTAGLMQRHPELYALINENRTESSLLLVLTALTIGMLIEDFGSWVEATKFDASLDSITNGTHSRNWSNYLKVAWRVEPVGARYIRTILLRMKFELGMAGGSLIAAFGVLTLPVALETAALVFVTLVAFAAILFHEAKKSHMVLSHTRAGLVEGIMVLGDPPKG
jgi:hypothetical protein